MMLVSLASRYENRCRICGFAIDVGDQIGWEPDTSWVAHEECIELQGLVTSAREFQCAVCFQLVDRVRRAKSNRTQCTDCASEATISLASAPSGLCYRCKRPLSDPPGAQFDPITGSPGCEVLHLMRER